MIPSLDSIKSYTTGISIQSSLASIQSISSSIQSISSSIHSVMGSKLTIHNRTNVIINVSLKQLGPVYWKNRLMPDEEWIVSVGKFWFTLEIKIWKSDGSNDYNLTDALVPIIDATITATTLALPVAGSASAAVRTGIATRRIGALVPSARALTPVLKSAGMLIGRRFFISISSDSNPRNKPCFRKYGLLMRKDKKFEIIGGPIESGVIINYSTIDPNLVTDQILTTNLGVIYVFEDGQLVN